MPTSNTLFKIICIRIKAYKLREKSTTNASVEANAEAVSEKNMQLIVQLCDEVLKGPDGQLSLAIDKIKQIQISFSMFLNQDKQRHYGGKKKNQSNILIHTLSKSQAKL